MELAVPSSVREARLPPQASSTRPETLRPVQAVEALRLPAPIKGLGIAPLDLYQVGDNDETPPPPEPPRRGAMHSVQPAPQPAPDEPAPDLSTPELPAPERPTPEMSAPRVAGQEVAGQEVAGQEVAGQEVSAPELSTPQTPAPEAAAPAAPRADMSDPSGETRTEAASPAPAASPDPAPAPMAEGGAAARLPQLVAIVAHGVQQPTLDLRH